MREALEEVKSRYLRLEEEAVKLPRRQADKVMRWWIKKLDKVTGAVRSLGIADWKEVEEKHKDTEDGGSEMGLIEDDEEVNARHTQRVHALS